MAQQYKKMILAKWQALQSNSFFIIVRAFDPLSQVQRKAWSGKPHPSLPPNPKSIIHIIHTLNHMYVLYV